MSGWYMFPFNYDPIWMIDECPQFSEEADPELTSKSPDPVAMLISLLKQP
jgi:hypothetical protein